MGWLEVGGWRALASTTYGRLLVAKVALVALALVLAGAAWNRFRLVPLLRNSSRHSEELPRG
jgi:copper transport protein